MTHGNELRGEYAGGGWGTGCGGQRGEKKDNCNSIINKINLLVGGGKFILSQV